MIFDRQETDELLAALRLAAGASSGAKKNMLARLAREIRRGRTDRGVFIMAGYPPERNVNIRDEFEPGDYITSDCRPTKD